MAESLHEQLRRALEGRIHAGDLAPGARLPTEKELCEQYGVSRPTAQRALNDLAKAGLAVRHRRHGSFVADSVRRFNLLNFVVPETAGKGVPGRHEVVSARVVRAADAVHPLPGAEPDAAVIELVRRKLDLLEHVQSVEKHVVQFAAAPDLLDQELEELVTLGHLRARGVEVDTVRLYLDPVVLDERDARLLDSTPGTPTLLRRRELRVPDGTVIEVVKTLVRPGTAEFFVELPGSAV